jgi:thiamine monophosphate kinase
VGLPNDPGLQVFIGEDFALVATDPQPVADQPVDCKKMNLAAAKTNKTLEQQEEYNLLVRDGPISESVC